MRISTTLKVCILLWVCVSIKSQWAFSQNPTTVSKANAYPNDVFLKWNATFLEIDRYAPGYRPGPAPRALAYLGLSAYESIVHGMPEFNSLASEFPDLALPSAQVGVDYYYPACVNESYYYLMKQLFKYLETQRPSVYAQIEVTYQSIKNSYPLSIPFPVLSRSENFGKSIAAAVYVWEEKDIQGHDACLDPAPIDYTPPVGNGLWLPTAPDFSRAVFPYWGETRSFALKKNDKICPPPFPYSEKTNSQLYKQALEVYQVVNQIKRNDPAAYEARWIAEFWSDDLLDLTFSPPTRLIAVSNQVVNKENLNLAQCAELYAKMGLALCDAGVATWKSKYFYNVERPITYIRRVLKNQYPDAANWLTALDNPITGRKGITPSFPAYPSGHSAFGGAGAAVLSSIFEPNPKGKNGYSFIDSCHVNRTEFIGKPRAYTSFKQLGEEDALSRIPLGVHFRMDCTAGLDLGELAAKRVLDLPWTKPGFAKAEKANKPNNPNNGNNNTGGGNLLVFPNPAYNNIQVDLSKFEGQAVDLFVYNQLGQQVVFKSIDSAQPTPLQLDVSSFKNGNFILRVCIDNQADMVTKFVIAQ